MKIRFVLVCLAACILWGCRSAATNPDLVPYLKNRRAAVFVFLAADCPISQKYTLTLNELQSEFKDVGFYGVMPGPDETDVFVKEYAVQFPVLRDSAFKLTDTFGATKTPEAFVVRADGASLYKGAIDNWAVELGQHRQLITEHYLRDVLAGRPAPKETNAVGCFIER